MTVFDHSQNRMERHMADVLREQERFGRADVAVALVAITAVIATSGSIVTLLFS